MEKRQLTKEDIDKVRGIEGFPIGSDEDIIVLSDAPYYTACPNPFIEEFIKENGHPYDEATDDYHREPFAADINEGKYDPIYKLHPYHTKVPHQAIMKYIEHYMMPGDIVLDGFAGTGMTGIAAQLSSPEYEKNGKGYSAILLDISPAATFISEIGNDLVSNQINTKHFLEILDECNCNLSWMYKTKHCGQKTLFGDAYGDITSVFWSDVYICPKCGEELVFWDTAVDQENGSVKKSFYCPKCTLSIKKTDCEHAKTKTFSYRCNDIVEYSKQVPVLINYTYGGKKYTKEPDENDLLLLEKIQNYKISEWFPTDALPYGINTEQPIKSHNFTNVDDFYFKRSLIYLAAVWNRCINNSERGIVSKVLFRLTKRYALTYMSGSWGAGGGPTPGTLFIPALMKELHIGKQLESAITAFTKIGSKRTYGRTLISTQSSTDMQMVPNNSIDYIFTDPPFGSNINYSELNIFWEAWLAVKTATDNESIVNEYQGKGIREYLELIQKTFTEYFRVLKPNRWITVEFHNSQNAIWNAIQTAISQAGFVVADVRVLSKGKESFKQIVSTGAVKQDLVISAYKPKESIRLKMIENSGSEETAWEFVRLHLQQTPTVVEKDGKIEVNAERQAFLLFDRMVAYHIINGIQVPLDATDFYRGLEERFLKRDGMYFLSNQVNEYDVKRSTCEMENIQFSLFISDEKSAIGWLYQELDGNTGNGPQTYANLMPKFMQELKAVDKREKMPELSVILEENFLKDDDGKWYIPDYTKSGDIAKLREKNLLKEFAEYQQSKGKLKQFRSEAIRAGFSKLWKDKDYCAIVEMAKRLPEETIQEDSNLLMYYDNSLSRAEAEPSQLNLNIN